MLSPLTNILQALMPSTCAACGHVLMAGERQLCIDCLSALDRTRYASTVDNPAERLLGGRLQLVSATALLRYRHESTTQRVIHAMKFHGNDELCIMMGRQLGLELLRSGRFDDVDLLVPIPLHWWRRLKRGYNQSELLCRGIAQVMPRPIDTQSVVRHRYTKKQSRQHANQRAANVEGAFKVRHPERLIGRHLLLVDDVLTTGATLVACADTILKLPDIRISIATLSMVG